MLFAEKIKKRRTELGLTLKEVADRVGVSEPTIHRYETGNIRNVRHEKIAKLAQALRCTPEYLMGWDDLPLNAIPVNKLYSFPVIGSISCGYDGACLEEYTGEEQLIPDDMLRGRDRSEFFVLKVKGESMFPLFLDGDYVFVHRTQSVDSGMIAIMLYNGDEATLKKVIYKPGEDWLEMVPVNPMYPTKRIAGPDLQECRVLGRVEKLIRNVV